MTTLPIANRVRALHPRWREAFALAATLLLQSCATAISGRTQTIRVRSDPSEARVTAQPGGQQATTPATLTLPRLESGYRLRFEKPGYAPIDIRLSTSTNGWVWGNIVIGGLIGLAVDYNTGAAYTLSPDEVEARLTPAQADSSALPRNTLLVFDQDRTLVGTLSIEQ